MNQFNYMTQAQTELIKNRLFTEITEIIDNMIYDHEHSNEPLHLLEELVDLAVEYADVHDMIDDKVEMLNLTVAQSESIYDQLRFYCRIHPRVQNIYIL